MVEHHNQRGSPKELKNLINDPEIRKLDGQWALLGLQLGIEDKVLDKIQEINKGDCMTKMLSAFLEIEVEPTWETVDNAVNATKKILDGEKKRKDTAEKEIATKKAATQLLAALQDWEQIDQEIGCEQKWLDDMWQEECRNWQFEERRSKKGTGVPEMKVDNDNRSAEEMGDKCNEEVKAKILLSQNLATRHRRTKEHKERLAFILREMEEWRKRIDERAVANRGIISQLEELGLHSKKRKGRCKDLEETQKKFHKSQKNCDAALQESIKQLRVSEEETREATRGLNEAVTELGNEVDKLQRDVDTLTKEVNSIQSLIKQAKLETNISQKVDSAKDTTTSLIADAAAGTESGAATTSAKLRHLGTAAGDRVGVGSSLGEVGAKVGAVIGGFAGGVGGFAAGALGWHADGSEQTQVKSTKVEELEGKIKELETKKEPKEEELGEKADKLESWKTTKQEGDQQLAIMEKML